MVIKIFGGKSEGKSTIAYLLKKVLSEQNIEIEIEGESHVLLSEELERNLRVIKSSTDPLKITIKSIPYERETLPSYATEFNKKI
jgi:ABC-type transport system involved in cytochrome bd biosynthesis fused ATPase/permease subunit